MLYGLHADVHDTILECTTGDLHWKCSSFHCCCSQLVSSVSLRLTFVSLRIKLNYVSLPLPVRSVTRISCRAARCFVAYLTGVGDVQSHKVHAALVLCEIGRCKWDSNILRMRGTRCGHII
jgi:hypothetical protein